MTALNTPPLIEAIFELRWGELSPGEFTFSQDEQSLFPGKVSTAAGSKGFSRCEMVNTNQGPVPIPSLVSHRFRQAENSWPCFQVGLGIFTVNQVTEGYDWDSFKNEIQKGIEIYNQAAPEKLNSAADTLNLVLRYQDAFFPEEGTSVEKFIESHFKINANLPDSFLGHESINRGDSSINFQVNTATNTPKGQISIRIVNAIIAGKPGLLMETIVSSKAVDAVDGELNSNALLQWTEKAHDLQKHSFKTLIKKSAYSC
tara:strand:+ start:1168 stop:1941 length:774 start_codon:yes stop_codon:yes gene_type:complete